MDAARSKQQNASEREVSKLERWLSRAVLQTLSVIAMTTFASTVALGGFDEGVASYRTGNYNKAFKEWTEAAHKGDADAQYNLGCLLLRGEGVRQNTALGTEWLQRAADQDHFDAAAGLLLFNLVTGDDRKKLLAMKDKPSDRFRLTFVTKLSNGRPYKRPCATDATEGAKIEFTLGMLYETGDGGFAQDDRQAAAWYRRASERNLADAQTRLAYLYAAGRGVEQSQIEAERLFRKAAERGDGVAQANLAAMYANGSFGHTKDPVLAYVLISHAADMGKKPALGSLPEIKALLSPDQLLEGQRLAEKWKPNTPWPPEIAARLGPPN